MDFIKKLSTGEAVFDNQGEVSSQKSSICTMIVLSVHRLHLEVAPMSGWGNFWKGRSRKKVPMENIGIGWRKSGKIYPSKRIHMPK